MSRRPGVGHGWFAKYWQDVYPEDFVLMRRNDKLVKVRPPRYYDNLYDVYFPEEFEEVKLKRKHDSVRFRENNSEDRLRVRETIQLLKFKQLKRGYESEV